MSANVKAALKKAKEALNNKEYSEARYQAEIAMRHDVSNYQALVFYGLANDNLGFFKESEDGYRRAIELQPEHPIAWQGLINLFEKNQSGNDQKLIEAYESFLPVLLNAKNTQKYCEIIQKLADKLSDVREREKAIQVLKKLLPGSEEYSALSLQSEPSCPLPALLWKKCIDWKEMSESELIQKEVNVRKFRLGAPPQAVIKAEVEKMVYLKSDLNEMYAALLQLVEDEHEQHKIHVKLFENLTRKLPHAEIEHKQDIRNDINQLVMIIMQSQYPMEPSVVEYCLENQDVSRVQEYNLPVAKSYSEKFPSRPLAKAFSSYFQFMTKGPNAPVEEQQDFVGLLKDLLKLNKMSLCTPLLLIDLLFILKDFNGVLNTVKHCKNLIEMKKIQEKSYFLRIERRLNISQARCYLQSSEREVLEAVGIFDNLIKAFPNDIEALIGLSEAYESLGKFQEMLDVVQKSINLDGRNPHLRIKLSWALYNLGQIDKSLQILQTIPEQLQNTANFHYRLGLIYWAQGDDFRKDKSKCFAEFIKAVQIDPEFYEGFSYLGHYYQDVAEDSQRAKKCYQKSFNCKPTEEVGRMLGLIYEKENDNESAIAVYEQIINKFPRASWAWKKLGQIYIVVKNYGEAATAFQCCLRIETEDCNLWLSLGKCYQRLGRYVAALKVFNRALQINPKSFWGSYGIATTKHQLNLFEEALTAYQQSLELADNKQGVPVRFNIAKCLLDFGNDLIEDGFVKKGLNLIKQSALKARQLENLLENQISYWRLLLECYIVILDYEDSLPELHVRDGNLDVISSCANEALKLSYRSGNQQLIAQFLLIYSRHTQSIEDQKIQFIQKALIADSESRVAWNQLGLVLAKVDSKLSQNCFIKAIELSNTQSAKYWHNLGLLYYINNELDLATKSFNTSQALDPEIHQSWFMLAQIKKFQGSNNVQNMLKHSVQLCDNPPAYLIQFYANEMCSSLNVDQIDAENCLFFLEKLKPKQNSISILNAKGLLQECVGQYQSAISSFEAALRICSEKQRKLILQNLARCLLVSEELNQVRQAYDVYHSLFTESTTKEIIIGMSLAAQKIGQLSESCQLLDAFIQQTSDLTKAHALIFLAQVQFQNPDVQSKLHARECLFQCYSQFPYFIPSIKTLLALGILTQNDELCKAALSEVKSLNLSSLEINDINDIYCLVSSIYQNSGQIKLAKSQLLKLAYIAPYLEYPWTQVALQSYSSLMSESQLQSYIQFGIKSDVGSSDHKTLQCVKALSQSKTSLQSINEGPILNLLFQYPYDLQILAQALVFYSDRLHVAISKDVQNTNDLRTRYMQKIDFYLSQLSQFQLNSNQELDVWVKIFKVDIQNKKYQLGELSSDDLIVSLQELDELNSQLSNEVSKSIKSYGYIVLARCLNSLEAHDQAKESYLKAYQFEQNHQIVDEGKLNI